MTKTGFFSIVLALFAAPTFAAGSLDADISRANGWVSWEVPLVDGTGPMCCFGDSRRAKTQGCDLDGRSWTFGTNSDHPRMPGESLTIYAHVDGGKVDKLRALATSCPVRANSEIHSVQTTPADSVAWIGRYVAGDKRESDYGLVALAYHAEPAATQALADLAAPGKPRDRRESALFWLGQLRGADGAAIVERYATRDDDSNIREHAIFALSQSPVDDAYARIVAISGSDPNDDVRSKALFWMAQMKDARAEADIMAALRRDASDEVREQAVFALSQLDKDADRALIAVIRGDYPRSAKEKALFWLGQSGSDEALAFMDEVLAKGENH
ncbi:MAG TPA: HEAT repeat domain-containing protein [Tahibacter sp.]|jgi:hypothetical protein|nr:HEAT repeat domain-containing protein [Tahibacter sp.]